jgi:ankyrin repeat protein
LDQGGYPDNVAILLQSGRVDVNRKDSLYGSTILTLAIGYKETKIAQMLLQTEGIDPDLQDGRGRFPLSMAARHGNLPIVRDLLDRGRVDVNAKDSSGRTALFWAASEGHVEVTTLLLAVPGVDVNSQDREGRAPIDLARDCEWHEVVLLLEQAGR